MKLQLLMELLFVLFLVGLNFLSFTLMLPPFAPSASLPSFLSFSFEVLSPSFSSPSIFFLFLFIGKSMINFKDDLLGLAVEIAHHVRSSLHLLDVVAEGLFEPRDLSQIPHALKLSFQDSMHIHSFSSLDCIVTSSCGRYSL